MPQGRALLNSVRRFRGKRDANYSANRAQSVQQTNVRVLTGGGDPPARDRASREPAAEGKR